MFGLRSSLDPREKWQSPTARLRVTFDRPDNHGDLATGPGQGLCSWLGLVTVGFVYLHSPPRDQNR
jgi:hypothetical protein